jgi:hypothetical protein
MGESSSKLPAASEDAVKSDEQRDGQQSAAREAMASVVPSVSVVPVRAKVRAMQAVRIPERPEDETKYQ